MLMFFASSLSALLRGLKLYTLKTQFLLFFEQICRYIAPQSWLGCIAVHRPEKT